MIVLLLLAAGAAPPAAPTPAQAAMLRVRDALLDQGKGALNAGRPAEAIPLLEKALAIECGTHGPVSTPAEERLTDLGRAHGLAGDWARSAARWREAAATRSALLGGEHWSAADARWEARTASLRAGWPAAQNARWSEADRLGETAVRLFEARRHKDALGPARRELAIRLELAGPWHPASANSLFTVASNLHGLGDLAAARPLYAEVGIVTRRLLGEGHPRHATALNNLAVLHQEAGEHAEAATLYRAALSARTAALGRGHPDVLAGLNNLATLHQAAGDLRAALPLFRRCVSLAEQGSAAQATFLNNLAEARREMGDLAGALADHRRAAAIRRKSLPARHPDVAQTLNNLAVTLLALGDTEAAISNGRLALLLLKETRGTRHPEYGRALANLAAALSEAGETTQALRLHAEAAASLKSSRGEGHPLYAEALHHLGAAQAAAGDHAAAGASLLRALEIRRARLGEGHPDTALSMGALALHRLKAGEPAAADLASAAVCLTGPLLGGRHPAHLTNLTTLARVSHEQSRPGAALPAIGQAIRLARLRLENLAAAQSERQALRAAEALRSNLWLRLSLPDEEARASHDLVVAWKGTAFATQRARRQYLLAEADPETRGLGRDLRAATRTLAALSASDEATRRRAEDLALAKERIEAELARRSAPLRAALRPPTSDGLRMLLPEGVALIDYLAYPGDDPDRPVRGSRRQRRMAAWVLRRDAATVRVDLGPSAAIAAAVSAWREGVERGDAAAGTPARALLWTPLEKHLRGVKQVLISPDGPAAAAPFCALPGQSAAYLVEEMPLSVLATPQALPGLLSRPGGTASMVALGGAAFGVSEWKDLPASGPEARAAAGRFERRFGASANLLHGARADADALRAALPGTRFAHLATHGYFTLGRLRSRPDDPLRPYSPDQNPGLLSGLVTAGGGVLTALEVAELDLSGMELAVLSACQTGLGKEATGEGLLGLQRAFAVAGCRSVVSSLWSVDDAATSVLMDRFYHHLWERRASKIEALRQAQLDVLHHPEWVEGRVRTLSGTRGLRGVGKASEVVVSGKRGRRSPPAWWAAWQLSGDWR